VTIFGELGGGAKVSVMLGMTDGRDLVGLRRHGDPNNAAIPRWPAYALDAPTTMLFDVESRVAPDWRRAERDALAEVPLLEVNR
jgi:carboxylesterase type B